MGIFQVDPFKTGNDPFNGCRLTEDPLVLIGKDFGVVPLQVIEQVVDEDLGGLVAHVFVLLAI
ncbi:hypothetical protein WI82_05640 [Burkholderia ubonensis]|nr:hypothetical protein WI82_05640 [Burkholderia ubonensis]KVT38407.1 hypothetical protein WK51_15100 [Burkholderia ubonensis]